MPKNTSKEQQSKPLRFVVIGAGMAGILSAIKLQEAGFTDFTIYEKADRFGGTWRENTYPGVACDVPSHLYNYSFSPNPDWTHVCSPGDEILAYFEDVAHKYSVEENTKFNTEISRIEFRDGRWHIETGQGEKDEADFIIAATGVLHHPSYPDIEGLEDFKGPLFHSARWDHSVPIEGKRVALIGTGSSAIQMTGGMVGTVSDLYLFQRTPQWVLPLPNPEIDEETKELYRTDPAAMQSAREELYNNFSDNFATAVTDANSPQLQMVEQLCKANLDTVTDPELREQLHPDYRAACKRLIMSPNFYEAIQDPSAHLITEKISRIEPNGIRTVDGKLHELDIIVLATGFRVDRFLRPIEVVGRDGVALDEVWAQRPSGYLSISIPNFPNLFMLNGPNGPVGNFSLIDVAELQFAYIMQLIDLVKQGRCQEVSVRQEAADHFEEDRVEATKNTVWVTGCRSWYLDDRGVPASWPWAFSRFREEMAKPKLEHYELVP